MTQHTDKTQFDDELEEGFGFDDLLRVLRRHWRIILGVAATFAAITAQVMMLMPNQYISVATVQVAQSNNQVLDADAVQKQMGGDTAAVESEVEVLKSADLALMVVERLQLRDDPEFSEPGWFSKQLTRLGLSGGTAKPKPVSTRSAPPQRIENLPSVVVPSESVRDFLRERAKTFKAPQRDALLQAFRDRIEVRRIRNSLLIEVKFRSRDAAKSARIANALIRTYLDAQIMGKDRAEQVSARLLNKRIGVLRDKLTTSERRLEAFRTRHDLFDADGKSILGKQLARETEQLVTARNRTADARARYEQARRLTIEGGDTSALDDVLKSQIIRSLRDQLARAVRVQAQLKTKYGPLHPTLLKANADVGEARSELVGQIKSIIRNFKSEMQIAEARQREVAANLVSLKRQIAESKDKTWQLEELIRDATTSRKLYETMLARSKQMTQTIGLQFPDARMVQHATVPLSPAGPKRKQFVLLAMLGGLVLAFGAAFLLETLRPGFETGRDAEKELLLEQIAALPAFADATPPDPMRNARFVVAEPQSYYAEAIRSLAHVARTRRAGQQIMLVMSSLSSEGRSTTASNLGAQFAVSGQRTLLIDADLRHGGLSRTLGLMRQPGLADVVLGHVPPSKAILRDGTTGLHVLPGRRVDQDEISPVELLNSGAAFGLFDALRGQFDMIIVDAPPILPVADTRVLSDIADSALMVVRWRQTGRGHVKQALRALGPNQSKVIGIVMSGVEEAEYIAQLGISRQVQPRVTGEQLIRAPRTGVAA